MTTEDQREMILDILTDMIPDDLAGYIQHVNFDTPSYTSRAEQIIKFGFYLVTCPPRLPHS
jgi:hypothetical protein